MGLESRQVEFFVLLSVDPEGLVEALRRAPSRADLVGFRARLDAMDRTELRTRDLFELVKGRMAAALVAIDREMAARTGDREKE